MSVPSRTTAAVLELHGDLYPPAAVERAIAAFSTLARCEVEEAGAYRRVRITALGSTPADVLRGELANYALAAAAVGPPSGA